MPILWVWWIFSTTPLLDSLTLQSLQEALDAQTLTLEDLQFEKRWPEPDSFRLPIVDSFLDDPLGLVSYLETSEAKVQENWDSPSQLLSFMAKQVFPDFPPVASSGAEPAPLPSLVLDLLQAVVHAQQVCREAFQAFSPGQLDSLLYEIYSLWSDEDDSTDDTLDGKLLRDFGRPPDTTWEIKTPQLLRWTRKVNWPILWTAGIALMAKVEAVFQVLDTLTATPDSSFTVSYQGLQARILGPEDDQVVADSYAVIIDFGGNDFYEGRIAGGLGGDPRSLPVQVVIDLAGDDRYRSPEGISQGAGVLGIGILIDRNGNDVYTCGPIGQGAGLFGLGVLWDQQGQDLYTLDFFGQGAGNFGLGLLIDNAQNDRYLATDWAQGFGSVWGYGLLADQSGNDLYYAGGHYRHRPLLPGHYRSFAQGFGMGWRSDASGGIGFLLDADGNDVYAVEVYGQGTSYWFSLGMLADLGGNDFYQATEYAQGAGIHLSLGILHDREGEDHYYASRGPSQGEGHDYSVGILIDEAGNDDYTVSGGLGIGLYNSVGLFIDKGGSDTYMIRERLGLGDANASRGLFGIGVFLDLGGADVYPKGQPAKNRALWIQGTYGVGYDRE